LRASSPPASCVRRRLPARAPSTRPAAELEVDDARDEMRVVATCEKQLRALGFVVVNLSRPRQSKQMPGTPDREYVHPGRGVFFKWAERPDRQAVAGAAAVPGVVQGVRHRLPRRHRPGVVRLARCPGHRTRGGRAARAPALPITRAEERMNEQG
jgi:hypothetical protein